MSADRDATELTGQVAIGPQALEEAIRREAWCWLEKTKLRMLSDVFGEGRLGALASARTVMLALSEIASDKQRDTFTAATLYIAQRAGVSSKTVRRMTKTFEKLRFVIIRPRSANGLRIASEYTVIRGKCPLRLSYPSMGKPTKMRLRRREESNEESTEGTTRKGKHSCVTVNKKNEQNGEGGRDDTVTDPKTGERFNKRTGEYEW